MNKRLKKKLCVDKVQVARILPGDVVVLKCNRTLSKDDMEFTCRQMMKTFNKNKVMVLDESCNIEIKRHEDNM